MSDAVFVVVTLALFALCAFLVTKLDDAQDAESTGRSNR